MDDLISRQAAVEAVLDRIDVEKHGRDAKPEEIQWTLEKLPSAQPERKTGRWLQISPARIYECSECAQMVMTDDISCYKYCHGCGAYMGGDDE